MTEKIYLQFYEVVSLLTSDVIEKLPETASYAISELSEKLHLYDSIGKNDDVDELIEIMQTLKDTEKVIRSINHQLEYILKTISH